MKKMILCTLLALALAAGLLTGCGEAAGAVGMMSIDVNPGIELVFDEDHKVVRLTPANEEAEDVIGGIDYTGSDVEDVAETLLYRMALKGYLTGDTSNILLSVDDSLLSKTALEKVNAALEGPLASINSEADLVTRVYGEADDDLQKAAHASGLTVGKYMLLQAIIQEHGLALDDLMGVTLGELLGYTGNLPGASLYNDDLYNDQSRSTGAANGSSAAGSTTARYGNSPNTPYNSPYNTPNDSGYHSNPTPTPTPTPTPEPTPAPTPTPTPAPTPTPGHDSPNTPYDSPHNSPNTPNNSPHSPNDSGHS